MPDEEAAVAVGSVSQTPLILHIHLFKNAGTSIERVLRDNYGDTWMAYDKDEPGAFVTDEEVATLREQQPGLAALSTHQFAPPLHDVVPGGVYPLLALRTPLTRIRSVYEIDLDGREITLYRVTPGESCVLTSGCLLSGMPYTATGIAETIHHPLSTFDF